MNTAIPLVTGVRPVAQNDSIGDGWSYTATNKRLTETPHSKQQSNGSRERNK